MKPPPATTSVDQDLEAAQNEEIDVIPSDEVTEAHIERLDDWAEIGWAIDDCGCLVRRGASH